MSNEKQNGSGFSIGLGGLCFITFIVFLILKLTGAISWAWWAVCIPLMVWGAWIVLWLIILVVVAIISAIVLAVADKFDDL